MRGYSTTKSYTAKAREELARAQGALQKTPEFKAVRKARRALDKAYIRWASVVERLRASKDRT